MFNQVDQLVTRLLDRGYEATARQVLTAISGGVTSGRVARRLDELEVEASRLAAEGLRLQPDNPVLVALLVDLETEMNRAARAVDGVSAGLQSDAVGASARLTRELALPGVDDATLARIGVGWNVPDPEAVNQLVGFANSAAWADEVAAYPGLVLDTVRNQAVRGIVSGWSPLRAAREIRRTATGLPAHVANNLMRTLYLQSYRRGTAIHQRANQDILVDQVRVGVLDQRTCLSCIALHGTVLAVGEVVVDHHQGRCTSVARVRGRPRNIQTGEQWFASLTADEKQNLAALNRSPGKYEALASGRATLRDFVEPYQDDVFGEMVREGSLRGALGGAR